MFLLGRIFAPLALIAALASLPCAAQSSDFNFSATPAVAKAAAVVTLKANVGALPARIIDAGAAPSDAIAQAKARNSDASDKRLQIGVPIDVSGGALDGRALEWVPSGSGFVAHVMVNSPGARALRVALRVPRVEPSLEVRFTSLDNESVVYGPFTAVDIATGGDGENYWSPVLDGDAAMVELYVAANADRFALSLSIDRVSHLFVHPADSHVASLAKAAGACEVDLICRSATSPALANAGKAVARMVFTVPGEGSFLCTGTLLNPTGGTFIPYFHSANHCISTQATASSLTTFWFYDQTGCGTGTTNPGLVQLTGGATLLYANEASDALLVRLNNPPPAGATFAGWLATTLTASTAITGIHHPAGDVKKVSLGAFSNFTTLGGGNPTGSFSLVTWTSGVTEGGSSGSGIFSAVGAPATDYQFRGGLWGGASSCSALTAPDFYSRFDLVYPSIAQYLNPPLLSGVLGFALPESTVREDAGTVFIGVTRTGGTAGAVSVAYTTGGGTAQAGSDFVATSGTLNWASGDAGTKFIPVTILRTTAVEGSEFFTITLSAPGGGATLGSVTTSVSIQDVLAAPRADVNGDGKADLFWRMSAGTGLSWWTMNATAITATSYFDVGAEWQVADVGDLDGDGKADIVWRRTTDGAVYLWTLDGLATKAFFSLGTIALDWTIAGVGDVNGDGRADIVWRRTTGEVYIWLMNAGTILAQGSLGVVAGPWQIADLADLDGDGRADIVFRNTSTGQAYVWFMNGLAIASQGNVAPDTPPYPPSWTLVGAADFNGDRRADLLWRDPAGALWLWFISGTALTSSQPIGTPSAGYEIKALGDLNGDGRADIVLRHPSGIVYVYFMNSATIASSGPVPDPGAAWQLVAP